MLWAVAAFAAVWAAGMAGLNLVPDITADTAAQMAEPDNQTVSATRYGILAMHILMAAYFAHLLARTIYLSAKYRKSVLCTIS